MSDKNSMTSRKCHICRRMLTISEERRSEIVFEVTEAPEGGYDARALGHGVFTQGEGGQQRLLLHPRLHIREHTAQNGGLRQQRRVGMPVLSLSPLPESTRAVNEAAVVDRVKPLEHLVVVL